MKQTKKSLEQRVKELENRVQQLEEKKSDNDLLEEIRKMIDDSKNKDIPYYPTYPYCPAPYSPNPPTNPTPFYCTIC